MNQTEIKHLQHARLNLLRVIQTQRQGRLGKKWEGNASTSNVFEMHKLHSSPTCSWSNNSGIASASHVHLNYTGACVSLTVELCSTARPFRMQSAYRRGLRQNDILHLASSICHVSISCEQIRQAVSWKWLYCIALYYFFYSIYKNCCMSIWIEPNHISRQLANCQDCLLFNLLFNI